MRRKLLQYLACPRCRSTFQLLVQKQEGDLIKQGVLKCKTCSATYPIINFIPRFVQSDTSMENFSFEWQLYKKTQLDTPTDRRSEHSFYKKTNFKQADLKGKLILDAGCGMGRYSDIVTKQGREVIGFDLSFAVDVCYENLGNRPNMHIIQADIFNLPLKEGIFDYIFSIGVLHHTGNAQKAFSHLVPHLKNLGNIAVWVYSSQNPVTLLTTKFFRIFTTKLPKRLLYYFCYLAIPLYYLKKIPIFYPLLLLIPTSMDHGWDWIVLVTFDWYSPKYMSFHSYPEVFMWFKQEQLNVTYLGEPTTVAGTKNLATHL